MKYLKKKHDKERRRSENSEDPDDFETPSFEEMHQECERYYELKDKTDRKSRLALKQKEALIKVYEKFFDSVDEQISHLDDSFDAKNLFTEVMKIVSVVQEGRDDEQSAEVLTKRIDQIYAGVKAIEADDELKSDLKALREKEKHMKEVDKGGRLVDNDPRVFQCVFQDREGSSSCQDISWTTSFHTFDQISSFF